MNSFHSLNDHQRENNHLRLLADVYMMANADAFVGTIGSNVDRTVTALRGAQNCRMLDIAVEDYRVSYPYLW